MFEGPWIGLLLLGVSSIGLGLLSDSEVFHVLGVAAWPLSPLLERLFNPSGELCVLAALRWDAIPGISSSAPLPISKVIQDLSMH